MKLDQTATRLVPIITQYPSYISKKFNVSETSTAEVYQTLWNDMTDNQIKALIEQSVQPLFWQLSSGLSELFNE